MKNGLMYCEIMTVQTALLT